VQKQLSKSWQSVFFTYQKNNIPPKKNDWITGEADIVTMWKVIDIKSPWSLSTFPATSESGRDKTYEWQGRAYMWLWDVEEFEIAYCLVNTPIELIGYEDEKLHFVDYINPELRITRVKYERNKTLEAKIKMRCEAANEYLDAMVKRIADEHTL
jgi:hypothetical protein